MKQSPIAASIEVCIGFSGVASAQAPACNSPSHRAFDFWIGVWQVRAANGKLADANSITKAHGGCVLRKQCRTPDADSGESLNIYDASRKLWHQTWTDSSGLLLILEGGSPDGKIVLEGKGFDAAGAPISHRIT